MKLHKKWFTATNLLIFFIVLAYILDRYLLPLPAGYTGVTNQAEGVTGFPAYLLGFCGGRLTGLFALCGPGVCANGGAFYRHITVVFTHSFLFHLLVNVIALYLIGNFIERMLGPVAMVSLFFLTNLIESYLTDPLYLLFDPSYAVKSLTVVSTGASSGVFGLMGIGLAACIWNKHNFALLKRFHKIVLALYGVIFTYLIGFGWTTVCHNTGFAAGIALGFLLCFVPKIKNAVQRSAPVRAEGFVTVENSVEWLAKEENAPFTNGGEQWPH